MMSPSPFDDALSRDFLTECNPACFPRSPAKKKWSFSNSFTSSSSATLGLTDDDDDDEEESFRSKNEGNFMLVETIEFDSALIQERYNYVKEINDSLMQMNVIQKDFSCIVDAQQADVNRICWMSIDAKETADKGLEHVKTATKNYCGGTKMGDSTCIKYMFLAGMAIADAAKTIVQRFQDSEGTNVLEVPLLDASARTRV